MNQYLFILIVQQRKILTLSLLFLVIIRERHQNNFEIDDDKSDDERLKKDINI